MSTREHVIYFDVDGTLTDNVHKCVPPTLIDALKKLKQAGFLLCISTGRRYTVIPPEILQLFPWDGFVCINGQTIHDKDGNLIYKNTMSHQSIRECVALANKTNTPIEGKSLSENFTINFFNENVYSAYRFFNGKLAPLRPDFDYDDVVCMMVFRNMGSSYDDFKQIEGIEVFPGMDCYADINSKGSSKFSGIQKSLEFFGKSKYIGIGDSLNDYDMLLNADIAISMGNGHEDLKAISNYITERPENDGILKAAEWIISNNVE